MYLIFKPCFVWKHTLLKYMTVFNFVFLIFWHILLRHIKTLLTLSHIYFSFFFRWVDHYEFFISLYFHDLNINVEVLLNFWKRFSQTDIRRFKIINHFLSLGTLNWLHLIYITLCTRWTEKERFFFSSLKESWRYYSNLIA